MWPWGHLAVGYLLYTVFAHLWYRHSPQEGPTIALAIGTQLPDLIDKPLAWSLEVLPHGRSFGHSLFTVLGLVVVLGLLFGRSHSKLVTAFAIGYLAHLFGDALQPVLAGEYESLRFLAWPVVPAVEYTTRPSFVGHVLDIEFTPFFLVQIGMFGVVLALWLYDRTPGLRTALLAPRLVFQKL